MQSSRLFALASSFALLACNSSTEVEDAGAPATAATSSSLVSCPGAVDAMKYYYPLRHGAELLDISYMDSPNGLPEYPGGGVMYDYHRAAADGSSYNDGIPHTPGFRDYMGNNTTYDGHNGYDNSLQPPRVISEGGGLVYPIAPGTVTHIYANNPTVPQAIVEVTHANGYRSRYWHLRNGTVQVRVNDLVDTSTVLAELDLGQAHLHFDFHDCDTAGDEPSYFEIYRADKNLLARKPFYEANPSDASDLSLGLTSAPNGYTSDVYRVRRGELLQVRATGQWRTNDTLQVDLQDPNGVLHGLTSTTRTDKERAIWFEKFTSYTIGAADPLGIWQARTQVNGRVRDVKYFNVTSAGSAPNANGPVQSAVSIVSSGSDNVHVYYRANDGHLFSYRWREWAGWDVSNHLGDVLSGAPSCVQRSATAVDCFYRNSTDGHLHRWASVDGGMNGAISDIHGAITGDPAAFSTGAASLEVAINDAGVMSLLHWNGAAFTKVSSAVAVGQAPSCVVADAAHWLCYGRAPNATILEIPVTSGVPGSSTPLSFASSYDVQANLFTGTLAQKHRIVVSSRFSDSLQHHTRIEYTDGTSQWMVTQSLTVGADNLSVPPRCAARPGTTALECYAADLDHNLVRLPWDGTRWLNWEPITRSPMDRQAPSLTALGGDRLDLFFTASPYSVLTGALQRTQQNSMWGLNVSVPDGYEGTYAPGCVARGGTKIDCFYVSSLGSISRRTYNAAADLWSAPAAQASPARSAVSAIATSSTAVSIMYFDALGNLREHVLGDSGWSGTSMFIGQPPGTTLIDAPGCAARFVPLVFPLIQQLIAGSYAIDCFARTSTNELVMITKSGGAWSSWSVVPGAAPRSAPSAVSMGQSNDEVFFRGADNTLVQLSRNGSWAPPAFLGGALSSAPSCARRSSPARIDCVAQGFRNLSQDLIEYTYQDSIGWSLPRGLGTGLVNLALHKTATQSSEYAPSPAPASRAVDGNLDGNFNHGSVTHTDNAGIPWWQVDLGASYWIDHVQVFNRTESSQARLNGFTVLVSDNGTSWTTPSEPVVGFARTTPAYPGTFMPIKTSARYVRVRLPSANWLHLAEVMVMGRESP